jgi:hypothetical protein
MFVSVATRAGRAPIIIGQAEGLLQYPRVQRQVKVKARERPGKAGILRVGGQSIMWSTR